MSVWFFAWHAEHNFELANQRSAAMSLEPVITVLWRVGRGNPTLGLSQNGA
jgi:hypothetical protein